MTILLTTIVLGFAVIGIATIICMMSIYLIGKYYPKTETNDKMMQELPIGNQKE